MAFYSNLSVAILGDKTRVAILRFLYRNRPHRFSQKQISDSVNIHPSSISRACVLLERFNLVDRFNSGKTILYKLDEESYITQKILVPLFNNENNFFTDLAAEIMRSMHVDSRSLVKEIFLFGSVVGGEDIYSSDIDIAAIVKNIQQTAIRTRLIESEKVKNIKEHFMNCAIRMKLNLDIHIHIEGENIGGKGLSLKDIYENGTLLWENQE